MGISLLGRLHEVKILFTTQIYSFLDNISLPKVVFVPFMVAFPWDANDFRYSEVKTGFQKQGLP